jgi:TatD DNase family protein
MRTTDNATSSVASGEAPGQIYYDTLFRNSKAKLVEPPQLPAGAQIADTHAHLDMLHNPELALARAAAHGVSLIITVIDPTENPAYTFNNLDSWLSSAKKILEGFNCRGGQWPPCSKKDVGGAGQPMAAHTANAVQPPEVRIIIGCHPHNASAYDEKIEQIIIDAVQNNPRVVGIGEIGLDYHYDNSPRETQRRVFARQIQLAHEYNMPIALHLREAHQEGLTILNKEGTPKAGALLHCFNLDFATLRPFLALDCTVAYGGPLTFKKSDDVRAAAGRTPINKLVTETDSPFMAPHPLRGTVCGPEDTIFTAALLAELVTKQNPGLSTKSALAQFYNNATNFFAPTPRWHK